MSCRNRQEPAIPPRPKHHDHPHHHDPPEDGRGWAIVSNHGYALLCLSVNPDLRLWQLAAMVGVRERSIHRILDQLVEAGYVTRVREPGHLRYQVHREMPLGRARLSEFTVGTLLDALDTPGGLDA